MRRATGLGEMNGQMQHCYTVNVCGGDRPGVLASVSRAVDEAGGRIESARKTVVDGNFTMIMTVNLPGRWGPTQLAEALRREGWPDWEHAVMVQPPTAREEPASTQRTQRFVVTVWGEDRPGVAGRLDICLAAKGIPITDLCGEWDGEEFALVAHIAVPADVALDSLQADLERLGEEFDCDVKLQELDVFLGWDGLSHAESVGCRERDAQRSSSSPPPMVRIGRREGDYIQGDAPPHSPDVDRRLLACELHDGPVQQFTGALFCLEGSRRVRETNADEAKANFDRGLHLLTEGIAEARTLLSDLELAEAHSDVAVAVGHFISNVKADQDADIKLITKGDLGCLAPPLQWAILRIVQESVRNALKHSGSRTIRVTLARLDGQVRIDVQDWGRGFVPKEVAGGHFGLRGIEARSHLLGGYVAVDSCPGHGTRITVGLPALRTLIEGMRA